jgi:hypothetical protein
MFGLVRRFHNHPSDLVWQASQKPCELRGEDVRDDHDTHVGAKCVLCERRQHIHHLRSWRQETVFLWTTRSMMIRQYDKPADPHNVPDRVWEEATLNGSGFVYGTTIAAPVRAAFPLPGH